MRVVKKITYKGKEIIYCDFRDCSVEEMIQLLDQYQEMILHDNHKFLSLINLNRAYATPTFMARATESGNATKHLLQKAAMVGIVGGAKKVLFKAYNFGIGTLARDFDTEEEAKEWLIKE